MLVTGGAGFLGRALVAAAPADVDLHVTWRRAAPPTGPTAHRVDLADTAAVGASLAEAAPDLVIHTAYGTDDGERDVVGATRILAKACADRGVGLVHLSSDVVFAGEDGPYLEDDTPDPISRYGRWKAAAEDAVREAVDDASVVRTSLLLSESLDDPRSRFVLDQLDAPDPSPMYVDELRQPILVDDLARMLWELATLTPRERRGVWHLAGREAMSRYALALLIAAAAGREVRPLRPEPTPTDVEDPRPRDLRLSTWRADAVLPTRPRLLSEVLASRSQPRMFDAG